MGVETFLTKYVSWAALKSQHNVVEIVVWPLKVSRKRVLGADNKDFVIDCHTRVTNKLDLIIYFALAQKDPKIQVTLNKISFTTTNMLLAPGAHIFFVRSVSTGGVHPASPLSPSPPRPAISSSRHSMNLKFVPRYTPCQFYDHWWRHGLGHVSSV